MCVILKHEYMRKPPLQDVIVRSTERRSSERRRSDFIGPPPLRSGTRRFDTREEPQQDSAMRENRNERRDDVNTKQRPETDFMESRPSVRRTTHRSGRFSETITNKKWLITALGIGAILVLLSVVLSLLFAGATIIVHPKQDSVTLDAIVTANATGGESVLKYEKIVLERTVSKETIALGEENVEERATGNIVVYNELSETPQRIIKQTRFKTPEGLVFRVDQSVEIPGKKPDGTPGSIEVRVRAEEAGEKYNIPSTSFTLPGYEESGLDEHYKKIYAKSTVPMEGGFVGIRRSVDEAERAKVLESLETQARDELISAAFETTDTPVGYYLFKNAVFFDFETLPDEPSDTDKVIIALKGKLHGVLLPVDDLESSLATFALSNYNGSPIRIDNLNEISVTMTPIVNDEVQNIWQATEYTFTVQGKAHFIWEFDTEQLKSDFVSKDKAILDTPSQGGILESHPGIDRLEVNIRPFWKKSFPASKDNILIITELDD